MRKLLTGFLMLVLIVIIVISQMTIASYKLTVKELVAVSQELLSTALRCGEALDSQIEWRDTCNAAVYTLDHTNEEYQRLIDKASEGIETCMANVEFFKELAAYNEENGND